MSRPPAVFALWVALTATRSTNGIDPDEIFGARRSRDAWAGIGTRLGDRLLVAALGVMVADDLARQLRAEDRDHVPAEARLRLLTQIGNYQVYKRD